MAEARKNEAISEVNVTQPGETERTLPILPVRDTVLFPHAVLPLTVGRESSVQLINQLGEEKNIVVVAQRGVLGFEQRQSVDAVEYFDPIALDVQFPSVRRVSAEDTCHRA